jgi:beta-mannosidase
VQRMDLGGVWDLHYCDPGEGERMGWPEGAADKEFVAARVPGDVHLDLAEAGMIEEPLHGRTARDCVWMEGKDWWYIREFAVPLGFLSERVEIHFAGLDTTAEVWVNGWHVGSHDSMFVPVSMDVTGALREGRNIVAVKLNVGLRSAEGKHIEKYGAMDTSASDTPRMWIRKAQFTFSWDWAPRLLTCGIWRGVELRSYDGVALRDVCLRTSLLPEGDARVKVLLEVENLTDSEMPLRATVSLSGRGGEHTAELRSTLRPGLQTLTAEIDVPDPALWWPAPLGDPNLYYCRVVVADGGQSLEEKSFRYGLREVELLRQPLSEEGESFTVMINGQKVYCKGADWVPADSLMARVSPTKYRELVRLAAEANFNMFRVWGGGIYEDPYFYQLCDEFGILVWQDFMYACSYYPDDDPDFVAGARREAELAVRRLRNHACVALWCGNNENQWIHYRVGQTGKAADRCYGEVVYDEVLPEVCAGLDPTRPYWPSSPYGGEDPNSEELGNRHAWEVNIINPDPEDQVSYDNYAEDRGKFISEFGILAPPALETLRQYLPQEELRRGSPAWEFHNNEFEKGTIGAALERYWRPAEELNLPDYVQYAQLIQAEALKFALEHWRRRKFDTSGALFWMYSDCWGAVGWTVVDYYLRKKPSYYFVRRAFEPVLASIQQQDERLAFWLSNDTLQDVGGGLEYGLVGLQGSEVQGYTVETRAAANSSSKVAELDISHLDSGEFGRWAAYCRFVSEGGAISRNRRFLAGFRFGALEMPQARFSHWLDGDALILQADSYVWQVRVEAPAALEPDDNHFDLLPGEERRIRMRGPEDLLSRVAVTALNE